MTTARPGRALDLIHAQHGTGPDFSCPLCHHHHRVALGLCHTPDGRCCFPAVCPVCGFCDDVEGAAGPRALRLPFEPPHLTRWRKVPNACGSFFLPLHPCPFPPHTLKGPITSWIVFLGAQSLLSAPGPAAGKLRTLREVLE